jgi:hypothetical protein
MPAQFEHARKSFHSPVRQIAFNFTAKLDQLFTRNQMHSRQITLAYFQIRFTVQI